VTGLIIRPSMIRDRVTSRSKVTCGSKDGQSHVTGPIEADILNLNSQYNLKDTVLIICVHVKQNNSNVSFSSQESHALNSLKRTVYFKI